MFIYIHQTANVRFNDKLSDRFNLTNGVRQGAVTSAILYCFYCEELFQEVVEGEGLPGSSGGQVWSTCNFLAYYRKDGTIAKQQHLTVSLLLGNFRREVRAS